VYRGHAIRSCATPNLWPGLEFQLGNPEKRWSTPDTQILTLSRPDLYETDEIDPSAIVCPCKTQISSRIAVPPQPARDALLFASSATASAKSPDCVAGARILNGKSGLRDGWPDRLLGVGSPTGSVGEVKIDAARVLGGDLEPRRHLSGGILSLDHTKTWTKPSWSKTEISIALALIPISQDESLRLGQHR